MRKNIDSTVYTLVCILTLGVAWVLRIIITRALVMADEQA